MKKTVVFVVALLVAVSSAWAVPALRGKYQYKQPDGTVVTLELHGDEYYHWTTDNSGRTVEMDQRGFYRQVSISEAEHRARRAKALAQIPARSYSGTPPETNFGARKVLCLLAEFANDPDHNFNGKFVVTDPYQHFWDMLNGEHYSLNGAYGSVRAYYMENSGGRYQPEFDVYGPVTLSNTSSYYDDNGVHLAINEAYGLLEDEIDISDYDTDNDGYVDMILFYFPGYNEAEHGPSWTIWPHQGTTSGSYGNLGGKGYKRYFCTSELRGDSGSEPAAIGTTCHEFAHSLGLPDFYDADKGTNGENSTYDLTYVYDLMCYGNYNDNGRRPPYLSAVERNMLGWMDAPVTILSGGDYSLEGVQGNNAYRIDSQMDGEFFVLECRDGSGWDQGLEPGLAIYHVDQSSRIVGGNKSAAYLWTNTNDINSYGGHPCYYMEPSAAWNYSGTHLVFPGPDNVMSFEPTGWDGNSADIVLSGISFNGSAVSFHVASDASIVIDGFVKDVYGQPVSGATVSLIHSAYEFAAPPLIPNDDTCPTDENGYYSFTLPSTASLNQVVTVTMGGYVSQAANVAVSGRTNRQDFVMLLLGQEPPATLKKYEGNTGYLYTYGIGGPSTMAIATRYSAEELAAMGAVGATISDVSFLLKTENGESVYVIVDIGGEKSLFQIVSGYTPGQYATVDLSGANLTIPAGKDVYIGVGVDPNVSQTSPFRLYEMPEQNDGFYFMPEFLSDGASWISGTYFGDTPLCVAVSATLAMTTTLDFAALDISYIALADGVPQVKPAAGKTVKSVTWTLDGTAVNGNPPAVETLSAGAHTYMARLEYYDGTAERVYFDVTKE